MSGVLHIVGTGPGDCELLTVKAARILGEVRCVAFMAKRGGGGQARMAATPYLRHDVEEIRFDYPLTTELPPGDPAYRRAIDGFYDDCAGSLAQRLMAGDDIALLCEGDPFFYGSAMYVFDRLRTQFAVDIVPGITAMSGCWSQAGLPLVHGDDVLMVLPATLDDASLSAGLGGCDAAVIMKIGRNFQRIRALVETQGRLDRALYIERGTQTGQKITPLAEIGGDASAPYFSLILLPGRARVR